MEHNVGDIQGGMDVFCLDGERLGIVTDVWLSSSDPDTPDTGDPISVLLPPGSEREFRFDVDISRRDESRPNTGDRDTAVITATSAATSYFKVEGEIRDYYLPFGMITTCFPGQSAMVDCTKTDCDRLYRRVP